MTRIRGSGREFNEDGVNIPGLGCNEKKEKMGTKELIEQSTLEKERLERGCMNDSGRKEKKKVNVQARTSKKRFIINHFVEVRF